MIMSGFDVSFSAGAEVSVFVLHNTQSLVIRNRCCLCSPPKVLTLKSTSARVSSSFRMISQQAGLKSAQNGRPHKRERHLSMTYENLAKMSGWLVAFHLMVALVLVLLLRG